MHATKPFAIGEGGAVFAHKSREFALRAALNFGLESHSRAEGPLWGVNGKMSEFHAAVGLAQARRFPTALLRRRSYVEHYLQGLRAIGGVSYPTDPHAAPWQFFPILTPGVEAAERFVAYAAQQGLEIRRYYRPSLSQWPGARGFAPCPVAEDLAQRMCVLPVRGLDFDVEADEMAGLVMAALALALDD
jgi:dTDP-4-amino-4,6-dideoxygalactose transaminase